MSVDFLEQMAAGSRQRVAAARRACSDADLLARALASPLPPRLQRHPAGFDLIAEMKLRSPAVGQLKSGDEDVTARVSAYARAGAAAVSVLTEPSRFDGSMAHLEQATKVLTPLGVPAMRKDFLVDRYQVTEARLAGAGGVLAILRMLPVVALDALIERARELKLFVLLEAFDASDIERMHAIVEKHAQSGVELLAGVNCRDLMTLQIVPRRLDELAHLLPTSVPRVAESGVGTAEDAGRLAAKGYELALVGSALMQGGDPRALAAAMLGSRAWGMRGPARWKGKRVTLWIKICGLTTPAAVTAALDAGADAIGFVFAKSVRQVSPDAALRLAAPARGRALCVAVTRHPSQQDIDDIVSVFKPDALQTDWADLAPLRLPALLERLPVLREGDSVVGAAVRGDDGPRDGVVALPHRLLFEGPTSGAGIPCDWTAAHRIARRTELILAGGLNPTNVAAAIAAVRPFGVDVSSGVEARPGSKSPAEIMNFVTAARESRVVHEDRV